MQLKPRSGIDTFSSASCHITHLYSLALFTAPLTQPCPLNTPLQVFNLPRLFHSLKSMGFDESQPSMWLVEDVVEYMVGWGSICDTLCDTTCNAICDTICNTNTTTSVACRDQGAHAPGVLTCGA